MGGHNVPPYEIERNFYGNLQQLNNQYKLIDELQIVDTTETANPKVLAIFKNGGVTAALPVKELPDWFENGLSNLFQEIYFSKNFLRLKDDKNKSK